MGWWEQLETVEHVLKECGSLYPAEPDLVRKVFPLELDTKITA